MVDIEGSISSFTAKKSYFVLYIQIIRKSKITELELICVIPKLSKIQKNYEITCFPWIDEEDDENYLYDEIILLPYFTPNLSPQPFEVIIKKSLKAISQSDYKEEINSSGKSGFIFIKIFLSLTLLLFLN